MYLKIGQVSWISGQNMNSLIPLSERKAVLLNYAQGMAEVVAERGANKTTSKDALLNKANIPLAPPSDFFSFITIEQYENLIRESLVASGDPAIALHMGKSIKFGHHGTFAFAGLSFPNVWETMRVGAKYSKLVNRVVDFHLEEGEHFNTLRIETVFFTGAVYQMVIEIVMTMFCEIFTFILEDDLSGFEINFCYGQPKHIDEYKKIFRPKIQFEAASNEIRIPKYLAEKPFAMANLITAEHFEKECDALLAEVEETKSIAEQIREILLMSIGNYPSLDDLASQLNVSPRTLRRRLQENDTSYKKILEQVRLEIAKRYLTTSNITIGQISQKLGYEDQNSFSHAFKVLTGESPSQFRRRAMSL